MIIHQVYLLLKIFRESLIFGGHHRFRIQFTGLRISRLECCVGSKKAIYSKGSSSGLSGGIFMDWETL